MARKVMNATATFNFTDGSINPGISQAEHYGACETLALWNSFRMSLTPSTGYDGDAIIFSPENDSAYAYMDITKMAEKGNILKIWFSGRLSFSICEDVFIEGQRLSKSVYMKNIAPLTIKKDIAAIDISNLDLEHHRYYLLAQGSGAVIELLVKQSHKNEDLFSGADDFLRNMARFNIIIEEKAGGEETIQCDFTDAGMVYNGLELSKDMKLRIGSNIDWGITKLKAFDLENEITKTGVLCRNGIISFEADKAYIESDYLRLDYLEAVKTLYIKINNYPAQNLKGFRISVLASDSTGREFKSIETASDTNLLAVSGSRLKQFIKLRIEAEEDKEIENIEVFAAYKEGLMAGPKVFTLDRGNAVTKIYDLGAEGSFMLKRIIYSSDKDSSRARFFIRGIRYDSFDHVYTRWFEQNENHVFNDYRYFQFRIDLDDKSESIRIKSFEMEAV